jgi:ABC-2 type transport system permease protein
MFSSILQQEIYYWFRQPVVYVLGAFFFLSAIFLMGGAAGAFDPAVPASGPERFLNAPLGIYEMIRFYHPFIWLSLAAVSGMAIYRDFQTGFHSFLYSYPISKGAYLAAKFTGAMTVMFVLVDMIGMGLALGALLPGVNAHLLGEFRFGAYWQVYWMHVYPNLLLFGALMFAVVALSRNMYSGFLVGILLLLIEKLAGSMIFGPEAGVGVSLLDPFGQQATLLSTRYWTIDQYNQLLLPFDQWILLNRSIWLVVGGMIWLGMYRRFHLEADLIPFFSWSKRPDKKPALPGRIPLLFEWPTVRFSYTPAQQWRAMERLSRVDVRYILGSRLFQLLTVVGLVFVFWALSRSRSSFDFQLYPTTADLLTFPLNVFELVICLVTFLYAGWLLQRSRSTGFHELLAINPIHDQTIWGSYLLTLVKVQALLLAVLMIGGISFQLLNGYVQLEIGLWLWSLFVLELPEMMIWAMVALGVHSWLSRPYLGMLLLVMGYLGLQDLSSLGIEHPLFQFNQLPDLSYTAMDGYGAAMAPYLIYLLYWLLLGVVVSLLGYLFWKRALVSDTKERIRAFAYRWKKGPGWLMLLLLIAFGSLGFRIYWEDAVKHPLPVTSAQWDSWLAEAEKRFVAYESIPQPRIAELKIQLDLFPEKQCFEARGACVLVNKTDLSLDTLVIHYSLNESTQYSLDQSAESLIQDPEFGTDVWLLSHPLAPGDSLQLNFRIKSRPNSWFRSRSKIRANGTALHESFLPRIGIRQAGLTDAQKRASYGLPTTEKTVDSSGFHRCYGIPDADRVMMDAVVSTSVEQTALAPGVLQNEWTENSRRYFHYKTEQPIKFNLAFYSGRYEVKRDRWGEVPIEIYYHPGHDENLDRLLAGVKASLSFHSDVFRPFQYSEIRLLEFPRTDGQFATVIGNLIPVSEFYFLADMQKGRLDLPFYVMAHEVAHFWWGNQLLPADRPGAKVLTESLSEYGALQVLKRTYGEEQWRAFLQFNRDFYLRGSRRTNHDPFALAEALPHQEFLHYRKGALAFTSLEYHLGASSLHQGLRGLLDAPAYPTTADLERYLLEQTPDTLHFWIREWLHQEVSYDLSIQDLNRISTEPDQHEWSLSVGVQKYIRLATGGLDTIEVVQLPVEFEFRDRDGKSIQTMERLVSLGGSVLDFHLPEKPFQVVIDPNFRYIDENLRDNRFTSD